MNAPCACAATQFEDNASWKGSFETTNFVKEIRVLLRNNEWQDEEQSFRIKVNDIECTYPGADMFYEWGSWITFICGHNDNGIMGDWMVIENTYPGHLAFCGLEVYGTHIFNITKHDSESDDNYHTDEYYYEDDQEHWDDYMDDYYYEDDHYNYYGDQCHETED